LKRYMANAEQQEMDEDGEGWRLDAELGTAYKV
jgi:hypothetical protein